MCSIIVEHNAVIAIIIAPIARLYAAASFVLFVDLVSLLICSRM